MSLLGKAIGSFLSKQDPMSSGINQDGGSTWLLERYAFFDEKYRVTVIVETKVEDIEQALQVALDNEDYEKARQLQNIIDQRKGYPPSQNLEP